MIDSATQKEIIETLAGKLKTLYVYPDIADQCCEKITECFETGTYDDITNGELFALALTEGLQGVSRDEHLWVRWTPEPLPDHEGSMLQNEERLVQFKQKAKIENYGIYKVERLPGNVGYIDIRYFYRPSWGSGDTAVAAMCFLANTSALIVDLRRCGGGNPNMVMLISSYLFEGDPIHLNSLYWRDEDFTQQYWTMPHVPGKRIVDQPIFVLTSNYTFSAGEEFAYNLRTRGRASLIGEVTSGGAHPGSPFRLHPHFEAFIPLGRAINPITHDNWEGKGITPDISTTEEQALETAYKLALESIVGYLGESVSGPDKQLLKEAEEALSKIREPRK